VKALDIDARDAAEAVAVGDGHQMQLELRSQWHVALAEWATQGMQQQALRAHPSPLVRLSAVHDRSRSQRVYLCEWAASPALSQDDETALKNYVKL
jgi:hypothetical protein